MSGYMIVPVSACSAPEAPLRHAMERGSLEELARSIQQVGLIQPLVVKKIAQGYEVTAGHRRLLACRMAGVPTVSVIVREDDGEIEAAVMLAENLQRADLSPVEEARAMKAMREVLGRSVEQIALGCSKSEAWVRGRLDLLEWPEAALEALSDGRSSVSALKPLMEIDNIVERDRLISCAVDAGASAQVTRSWAQQAQGYASDSPEMMSAKGRILAPLGGVQVFMPCYSCREPREAFGLEVVRICRPCLEDLENAVGRMEKVAPTLGVAVQNAGV